jgi:AAT family amino acid transporter
VVETLPVNTVSFTVYTRRRVVLITHFLFSVGGRNWTIGEAPFVDGFKGFASLFVSAAFAYGGTESIGLTAAEQKNPIRNIPRTIYRVFWRIIIFYICTVIIIGFNVPYNMEGLTTKSVKTSPFTLMFQAAGSSKFFNFFSL